MNTYRMAWVATLLAACAPDAGDGTNSPPRIAWAVLESTASDPDARLSVRYQAVDPDGDPVHVTIAWRVDDQLTALGVDWLDATELAGARRVEVELVPEDGIDMGARWLEQLDLATDEAIWTTPAVPQAGDDILCELSVDASRIVRIEWLVDGHRFDHARTARWPGDQVPGAFTMPGQHWECTASLDGGEVVRHRVEVAPRFRDQSASSGFSDGGLGYYTKGRACVAADFDNDGRDDLFIGNPGDTSYVLTNTSQGQGSAAFEPTQVLLEGAFAWGGAASDFDNDGDLDLFVSGGGNETAEHDRLFRNDGTHWTDITEQAGILGPVDPVSGLVLETRSANAVWADIDHDGDNDLFVNGNAASDEMIGCAMGPQIATPVEGRNVLWRNNGDGTFTDITDAVGLGLVRRPTRHSTFLDVDNDGDLDLYENNFEDFNVLWINELVQTGTLGFTDQTAAWSLAGQDLALPWDSFSTAVADLNHDGWQDLVVFAKGRDATGGRAVDYGPGHAMFINTSATGIAGFVNVATLAGLDQRLEHERGVMGSQLADIDADGVADLYIGNGAPVGGHVDFLLVSDGWGELDLGRSSLAYPTYADWTSLIDYPAPEVEGVAPAAYPYRTHGVCISDYDGDGMADIAVVNGGPGRGGDEYREPNRLFVADWQGHFPGTFTVHLVGDGDRVARDAIGSRASLDVVRSDGSADALFATLVGGSGFSAQNGMALRFGLQDVARVRSLTVWWPDGSETVHHGPFDLDKPFVATTQGTVRRPS